MASRDSTVMKAAVHSTVRTSMAMTVSVRTMLKPGRRRPGTAEQAAGWQGTIRCYPQLIAEATTLAFGRKVYAPTVFLSSFSCWNSGFAV